MADSSGEGHGCFCAAAAAVASRSIMAQLPVFMIAKQLHNTVIVDKRLDEWLPPSRISRNPALAQRTGSGDAALARLASGSGASGGELLPMASDQKLTRRLKRQFSEMHHVGPGLEELPPIDQHLEKEHQEKTKVGCVCVGRGFCLCCCLFSLLLKFCRLLLCPFILCANTAVLALPICPVCCCCQVKNIQSIELGKHEMDTWYYSPYPEPYASCEKVISNDVPFCHSLTLSAQGSHLSHFLVFRARCAPLWASSSSASTLSNTSARRRRCYGTW